MEKAGRFSFEIRRQVHREQQEKCAYCGEKCDGHRRRLEVHHITPRSLGGPPTRENAVGLCGPHGCHDKFNELAFQGISFYQVMMEEGREYTITPQPRHPTRRIS